MVDTIIERRRRFRRSSDRNFGISITAMFALTLLIGGAIGWYIGVEQTARHALEQQKRLLCVDNINGNR